MNKKEKEYICQSFVETAFDKKTKDNDIVYYTIKYKNNREDDVIIPSIPEMVKSIVKLLDDKDKIKTVEEIQFKVNSNDTITVVNKLEIC